MYVCVVIVFKNTKKIPVVWLRTKKIISFWVYVYVYYVVWHKNTGVCCSKQLPFYNYVPK